jgi:hypothetical protein
MSSPTAWRPDLKPYEHSAGVDFPVLVKELSEFLGPKLVAYIPACARPEPTRGPDFFTFW